MTEKERKKGILGILPLGPIRATLLGEECPTCGSRLLSPLKSTKIEKGEEDVVKEKVQKWQEKGYPLPLIRMALNMADDWLSGVTKAVRRGEYRKALKEIAPPGKKPREEPVRRWRRLMTRGEE